VAIGLHWAEVEEQAGVPRMLAEFTPDPPAVTQEGKPGEPTPRQPSYGSKVDLRGIVRSPVPLQLEADNLEPAWPGYEESMLAGSIVPQAAIIEERALALVYESTLADDELVSPPADVVSVEQYG
jgi:hypothetical protein